jgi:hypothetical protein
MSRATLVVLGLLFAGLVPAAAVAAVPPEQVTCGQIITRSTTLANDLTCGGDSPALVIGARGITLDLNGHTVFASADVIRNYGYPNVAIQNGTLATNSVSDVALRGARRNRVRDLELTGLFGGVTADDSPGTRIVSNQFIGLV